MNPLKVGVLAALGLLAVIMGLATMIYGFFIHPALGIILLCLLIGTIVGLIVWAVDKYDSY